jgi:RNA polymerase sigma-70 factor (ECF subfamily)
LTLAVPLQVPPGASASDPLDESIRGALDGDPACAHQLCIELGPVVLRTLRRVLGHGHADLEDVLQDTLIAILDGLDSFKRESSIRHYARRIATFRALELIRNRRTRARKLGEMGEADLLSEPRSTPFDELASRRRERVLHDLLASLSPEHAEVLTLRAVLGHSVAEMAEILGIPFNTVRGRLQTAKGVLRTKIRNHSELSELLLDTTDHEV